jgi:lipoprotein-releasing system permease protein
MPKEGPVYKVLLCWRYLKTRYLALACIISVMLGVATLIVVNSVMSGFSTKLRDRLHGLLSDVLIESSTLEGFGDPNGKIARIRQDPFLAEKIEAMTPTMEVFAMLQFRCGAETITRPVRLIGVEPEGRAAIGGFSEHLTRQKGSTKPSFAVSDDMKRRYEWQIEHLNRQLKGPKKIFQEEPIDEPPPPLPVGDTMPPSVKIPRGAIVGKLIASFRYKDKDNPGKQIEHVVLREGDTVVLTTVSGARMAPVSDSFLVVDYFTSEMSEYDSNCVFVPLDYLQHLRTMQDRVTSIQIRLKDPRDAAAVKDRLQALFGESASFHVVTWEDKQSSLLAAINIEKGILNVLLFLIIGVAGFGILAIFSMIVAEKTRDIGILKALGASNWGVMKIFLSYGFLLGVIGTLLGTGAGVWLTVKINVVEQWLSDLTGQQIFDRSVYYFNEIPTDIQLWSVLMVNVGAVTIATVFSVLPALRAAMLHPVRALRYE